MNLDTDPQVETEEYFATRAPRFSSGRASEILARAGQWNLAKPRDELPANLVS